MLPSALRYSHQLLQEIIEPTDTVVDATMGNGHDTLFLAQLVPKGQVYSVDIQPQALVNTKALLTAHELTAQITLSDCGHHQLEQLIPETTKIKAAVFNLGYLPKSDKQVITTAPTTLAALEQLLPRLVLRGRIILVAYYGHEGGQTELAAVESFCANLDQHHFQVLHYQFINQKNQPPILFCIERRH